MYERTNLAAQTEYTETNFDEDVDELPPYPEDDSEDESTDKDSVRTAVEQLGAADGLERAGGHDKHINVPSHIKGCFKTAFKKSSSRKFKFQF